MRYFLQWASAPDKFEGDWTEVGAWAYCSHRDEVIPWEWSRSVHCTEFWAPHLRGKVEEDKMSDRRDGTLERRDGSLILKDKDGKSLCSVPYKSVVISRPERRQDEEMREKWRSVKDTITYTDPVFQGHPDKCEDAGMRAMYQALKGR